MRSALVILLAAALVSPPAAAQSPRPGNGGGEPSPPGLDLGQLLGTSPTPTTPATPAMPRLPDAAPICFEVVAGAGVGPILVDRCNGKTWLLTRDAVPGAKGAPSTSSAWRWHPLSYDNRELLLGPLPGGERDAGK